MKIENYKKYMSFVVGIIDGIASFVAGFGQMIVGYISQNYDWSYVFYLFMGCIMISLIGISCLIVNRYRNSVF
jgi:sugar phosphate permease